MSQISVIIVSWNALGYLRNCLASIRATADGLVREIIVVDNESSDGSPEMVEREFPEVTVIRSGGNLGFARANNLAIQRATGPWLALINSDVVVHPGCFSELIKFLEQHPQVGLAGPRISGGDGNLQISCRRFPTVWNYACCVLALDRVLGRWPLFSGFEMRHWDYERQGEVEMLSGCFWMARKAAVDQVGGLDERFFFYAEDIDWCKRFRDAGWKNMFLPQATATHFGGGSSANAPLRYSIEMLRANLTYWRKHHGVSGQVAYYLMALLYHGFRFVPRALAKLLHLTPRGDNKLREHLVCMRWLLTGKRV